MSNLRHLIKALHNVHSPDAPYDDWVMYSHHNDMKVYMQAEAAALKVPVRFLHQLRTLLPQSTAASQMDSMEDMWSDAEPEPDDAELVNMGLGSSGSEMSSEEEDSNLGSSALQAALIAASQQLAAGSGTLTQPAFVITHVQMHVPCCHLT